MSFALSRGDLDAALVEAERMVELGARLRARDLQMLGLQRVGQVAVARGDVHRGLALLDEAVVAAISGELGTTTTAVIYCSAITACRNLGDYRRAGEWSDAATRWCERETTTGFPGLCRVYRAEILRRRGELLISETRHGFICANAGVDLSNVAEGTAALLPDDPDRSARKIRAGLRHALGVDVAVIVSDTFGRPWRRGVTDVAIGCAGVAAVLDLKGTPDAGGRELQATEICIADELASAAELVMGKDRAVPVAIVRGVPPDWLRASSVREEIIRPPQEDLFR